jgi:DNA-nicking Smr family endonuclease
LNDESDFLKAMGDVKPLEQKRVHHDGSGKEVTFAELKRREAALGEKSVDPNFLTLGEVVALEPYDTLNWKKEGVQPEVFKNLQNERYPIDAELDLHGLTVKEARSAMYEFLNRAVLQGWRMLKIAHGRGVRSQTPARIKSYVNAWLMNVDNVVAFHSAQPSRGGTGAVLVMMRKSAREKEFNREVHGQKRDYLIPREATDTDRR